MIASPNFPQVSIYKTPGDGNDALPHGSTPSIAQPRTSKRPSLYSIITGRNDSLFSNISQQTVTVSTSLHSSTNSLSSNQLDHDRNRSRFRILKKAKSTFNMSTPGPVSPSSSFPSDLSRVYTAIPQSSITSSSAPVQAGDGIELQSLDMLRPGTLSPVDGPNAPKLSVRVVGRGGQGSRPRPANNQLSRTHHSEREPISPSSSVDPSSSVNLSGSSTYSHSHPNTPAVPGPISIARVVGRGGLGSKRRIHLNPSSPLPTSPSVPGDHRHERIQSTSSDSQASAKASSSSSTSIHARTIRVTGRGGAGSRIRVRSPSPAAAERAAERSLVKMCKIKWKARKRTQSQIAPNNTKPPSKLSVLKRSASQHITSISKLNEDENRNRPLPPVPASPPVNTHPSELENSYPNSPISLSLPTLPSNVQSLPAAAPPSKAERMIGHALPAHLLLSPNDFTDVIPDATLQTGIRNRRRSRSSVHSLSSLSTIPKPNSNRRASLARSLSSLGSFIVRGTNSRPSSEVFVYAEEDKAGFDPDGIDYDDKEDVCWVDNEYESHSREGATTPISPMIFSVRPPSPTPPKLKLVIDSGPLFAAPSTSVVSVESETSGTNTSSVLDSADGSIQEEEANSTNKHDIPNSQIITPATSVDDSVVSHSPIGLSPCDGTTGDAAPPVSPIVFSEHDPETPPITANPSRSSRSEVSSVEPDESTPRTKLKALLSEPLPISSFTPPISPFQNLFMFANRRETGKEISTGSGTSKEVTTTTLTPQGWSGEWNRKDMQDVIRSLRELK
ncbi:hypothetical protein FB446DRAFT_178191 [Lentinula raphanica]|nr:hypothetical protein FB446DRAFT_178191 [Lentinula raphanica]